MNVEIIFSQMVAYLVSVWRCEIRRRINKIQNIILRYSAISCLLLVFMGCDVKIVFAEGGIHNNCVGIDEKIVSKMIRESKDLSVGSAPFVKYLNGYQNNKIYFDLAFYNIAVMNNFDIDKLTRVGVGDAREILNNVVNYVIAKYAIDRDEKYKDLYLKYRGARYLDCVLDKNDPILKSLDIMFLSFDDPDLINKDLYVETLRYASQVSTIFLRDYLEKLSSIGEFIFSSEKDYWRKSAKICDKDEGRSSCLIEIKRYVEANIDIKKNQSARSILCSVGIVDSGVVYTARVC